MRGGTDGSAPDALDPQRPSNGALLSLARGLTPPCTAAHSTPAQGNFKEAQTKEIKNGRLAMIAFAAFTIQAQATGKGPLQNLSDHLSAPFCEPACTGWLGCWGGRFCELLWLWAVGG